MRGGDNIAVIRRAPILSAVEWILLLLILVTLGVLGFLWLQQSRSNQADLSYATDNSTATSPTVIENYNWYEPSINSIKQDHLSEDTKNWVNQMTVNAANEAVNRINLASADLNLEIGLSTILSGNIANGAITSLQLSDDSISSAKIIVGAVSTENIAPGAITNLLLANNAVGSSNLIDGSITNDDLGDGIIDADKLANDSVTSAKIVAGTILTDDIAIDAITGALIADATISTTNMALNSITTGLIADGAVGTTKIAANAITSSLISNGAILGEDIASGAIGALQLATDAVTSDKILAEAITSTKIASNAVGTSQIAANAVQTSKLSNAANTKTANTAIGSLAVSLGSTNEWPVFVAPSNGTITKISLTNKVNVSVGSTVLRIRKNTSTTVASVTSTSLVGFTPLSPTLSAGTSFITGDVYSFQIDAALLGISLTNFLVTIEYTASE